MAAHDAAGASAASSRGCSGFDDGAASTNYLNASTNVRRPGNRLGGELHLQLRPAPRHLPAAAITTYYNAQCCGFAIEYQTYNYSGSLAARSRRTTASTSRSRWRASARSRICSARSADSGRQVTLRQRARRRMRRARPTSDRRRILAHEFPVTNGRTKMVNVLVTGGAGFIGSNFVRYALASASRLARHDARQADLRRAALENLHDVMDHPRHTLRARRHRRRRRSRRRWSSAPRSSCTSRPRRTSTGRS